MKALKVAVLAATMLVVAAAPAMAHHNTVQGSVGCQADGQALVTWTGTNSESSRSETVTLSNAMSATFTVAAGGTFTRTQLVPGTQSGTLTLHVHGVWTNGVTHDVDASVRLPGNCPVPTTTTKPPTPTTTVVAGVVVPPTAVVVGPRFTG